MKIKNLSLPRNIILVAFFVLVCLVYCAKLISIQIAGRDFYELVSTYTYTRTEIITAQRGEIFDRNGIPLVTNVYTRNIIFDYASMPVYKDAFNRVILRTLEVFDKTGNTDKITQSAFPLEGTYPNLDFKPGYLDNPTSLSRLQKMLSAFELPEDVTSRRLTEFLVKRYALVDGNGKPKYAEEEMIRLLQLRYDMEYKKFSRRQPYVLAEDVDIALITQLRELNIRGISVTETVSRHYNFPGYASHILGRVGRIPSESVDYYKERGYSLDAIVGVLGAEKVFEDYLRGIDGEKTIVEDAYGNILEEKITKEPVAGKDVWLTLDINMQIVAEDALKNNIALIVDNAKKKAGTLDGEDASAGAITVVAPKTGEVLAMASYPTFNLENYNSEYAALSTDPLRPLFNRALTGLYPPGSTFKLATSAAALSEGVITADTKITDRGIYTYYPDYQPRCHIYVNYGTTHGTINVVQAIQHSCNYFFYEVGRLLTIERLNQFCRQLGLGATTGIEFPEPVGILAGPEYRENNGLEPWSPGDTLQAAIGQSDNAFTPLQLAVYMSTLLNGGARYRAHLLHSVHDYSSKAEILQASPDIISTANLSGEHTQLLKTATKSVVESGSAARLFRDYPIDIGGKTGTAQVSNTKSANAIFVAYAPFDEPEIVASCIIEQGANGTDAGFAIRDVFNYYFNLNQ